MSESLSPPPSLPSDDELERVLRKVVQDLYKSGNLENLTVKRVRKAAEAQLDVKEGFFRDHGTWKERSKEIIQSEVEAHPEPASSQASPPKKPLPVVSKASRSAPTTNGKKRSSAEATLPKKRQKHDTVDASDSASAGPEEQQKDTDKAIEFGQAVEGSESEMSDVLDESPKPKRKRKSTGSEKPKPKKRSAPKAPKPDQPTDPDAEEIKRLQGWLVKCGIRKMWWKELQPFDTPKAKIRHLKDMLSDAGMTGRYSSEKASQIKEERELKADLEAVQAGNKQWGKTDADAEATETSRPKRRLAKGLSEIDFLNDDDGEETD